MLCMTAVERFLRVIMSSSLALSCLPSEKKQKHDFFCFVQCTMYNKTIIRFGFCDIRIIKVSVRVIIIDYSGYHQNFIQ